MVKSEKRLIVVQIVLFFIFLLNIFVKKIQNDYYTFLIIFSALILLAFLVGYEKNQAVDEVTKRKIMKYVGFYCLGFIIFEYGLGFFLNFVKTPYKRDIFSIIKNIFSSILIIISSEYLRYTFVKKGEKRKIIIVFTVLLFIVLDLSINVIYYDLSKADELLKFVTSVFLVSLFKNIILTRLTYYYGITQNILYRLIIELYIYFLPFIPDLGIYIESVLLMVFPFILNSVLVVGFDKEKKKDYRDSNLLKKIVNVFVIVLVIVIVSLNSNIFRFWLVMVASGSMEPTIKIGDAIIVDKSYKKNLNKIKVGDVLAFKVGENVYVHRIIEIKVENENYSIKTKGDRKGQSVDNWVVTNNDVIGVVKLKIKYIGYPTVWLSWKLEGKNG